METKSKVFLALPCGELSRYPWFWSSLMELQLPAGSVKGPPCQSPYIENNQNILARLFLQTDCTHFFLTNDDQVYPPQTVLRLLEVNRDVVVPLCLGHELPHEPLVYDRVEGDSYHHRYLQHLEYGIHSVVGSGGGGMLIRRIVFETIPDPWWETHTSTLASVPVSSTEDLDFCKKVIDAGFDLVCDLDTPVGHITPFIVWPNRRPDGSWVTAISRGTSKIEIPTAQSPLAVPSLVMK
jgi:hypothetical protein